MHSFPESYQLVLQTITAVEQASATIGGSSTNRMKSRNLINFFMKDMQHHIIIADHSKNGDSALVVYEKKGWQGHEKKGKKSKLGIKCDNFGKSEHIQLDYWFRGGEIKGQGSRQKKSKKGDKKVNVSATVVKI
jgi:hypothetical protein